MFRVKRVYEPAKRADGLRVLVDRLWPRGLRKEDAKIDMWLKDVAPSRTLRNWFMHEPAKWKEFKKRYFEELDEQPPERLNDLRTLGEKGAVTLLFGTKEERFNNAVALQEYLVHHIAAV